MTIHTPEGRRRADTGVVSSDPWDTEPVNAKNPERPRIINAQGYLEESLGLLGRTLDELDEELTVLGGDLAPILSDPNPEPGQTYQPTGVPIHDGASQIARAFYSYGQNVNQQADKVRSITQAINALRRRVEA